MDINQLFCLINKLLTENYSLYEHTLEKTIGHTLNSFERFFILDLSQIKAHDFINGFKNKKEIHILQEKLKNWLLDHHHPKVLVEGIYDSIIANKFEQEIKKFQIYEKLVSWLNFCNMLRDVLLKEFISLKKTAEYFETQFLLEKFFKFIDQVGKRLNI